MGKGGWDIKIRVQKSDMTAKSIYDFKRLEEKNYLLIPCKIEEEKETVRMCFDLRGMQRFEELKGADKIFKLIVLLHAAELEELYQNYDFSLEPENLYYDILGRVKVKKRDIIPSGQKNRMRYFLRQYQALAGYLLDGSRAYEDYLHGGPELMKADDELLNFMEPETVQEEKKILSEYYVNLSEQEKKHMKKVGIQKYRRMVVYDIVSVFLLILLSFAVIYSFSWHMPRQERLREAGELSGKEKNDWKQELSKEVERFGEELGI